MILAMVNTPGGLGYARPMDPARDMGAIADLIEVAFRGELDRSASGLVAEMRHLASLGPLLTIADRVSAYPSGYVWEQGGRVVGNANVSVESSAVRRWLISNVAVHPEYRGRGIGRQLMEAVLAGIRRRGGRQVLLQVRTENEPAQRLYRNLGFERFDTLVELMRPGPLPQAGPFRLPLRPLRSHDWQALLDLAQAATPPGAQRIRPLVPQAFRPRFGSHLKEWLDGLLGLQQTRRWGLEERGVLLAAISLLAYGSGAPARLDLSVRPTARGPIEGALADAGLAALAEYRPRAVAATVSASHPEAVAALTERHFAALRSLDQLVLALS